MNRYLVSILLLSAIILSVATSNAATNVVEDEYKIIEKHFWTNDISLKDCITLQESFIDRYHNNKEHLRFVLLMRLYLAIEYNKVHLINKAIYQYETILRDGSDYESIKDEANKRINELKLDNLEMLTPEELAEMTRLLESKFDNEVKSIETLHHAYSTSEYLVNIYQHTGKFLKSLEIKDRYIEKLEQTINDDELKLNTETNIQDTLNSTFDICLNQRGYWSGHLYKALLSAKPKLPLEKQYFLFRLSQAVRFLPKEKEEIPEGAMLEYFKKYSPKGDYEDFVNALYEFAVIDTNKISELYSRNAVRCENNATMLMFKVLDNSQGHVTELAKRNENYLANINALKTGNYYPYNSTRDLAALYCVDNHLVTSLERWDKYIDAVLSKMKLSDDKKKLIEPLPKDVKLLIVKALNERAYISSLLFREAAAGKDKYSAERGCSEEQVSLINMIEQATKVMKIQSDYPPLPPLWLPTEDKEKTDIELAEIEYKILVSEIVRWRNLQRLFPDDIHTDIKEILKTTITAIDKQEK